MQIKFSGFPTKELQDDFIKHSPAIDFAEKCRRLSLNRPLLLNQSDLNSLVFNIEAKQWFTIQAYYGHAFVIGLLRYYESIENYENCAGIKKDIELMSATTKTPISTNSYETYDVTKILNEL